jgi:hypothetical protein
LTETLGDCSPELELGLHVRLVAQPGE